MAQEHEQYRAPRTDRTRAALILWGGWLLVTGLVLDYMRGTVHPYYTVALAPAIAALVAIGAKVLAFAIQYAVTRIVITRRLRRQATT